MRGAISGLALAACLAVPSLASAQEAATPGDPWENVNRDLFAVHESVDRAVVEPVARGYRAVTPRPVRQGVLNVLRNLRGPVIFANDVLQGEFRRAGTTGARFTINSTIGIAGIFDPASSMGFERHDEDFGQTLAVWGVEPGPYIFIPLMGPSNLRDTTGRIVDTVFDPLSWARGDEAETARTTRTVFAALAAREQVLDVIEDIRRDSVDPYASIRGSYTQLRESAIQNGRTDVQDLPDFDDIPEMSDETAPTAGGGDESSFATADQYLSLTPIASADLGDFE